MKSRIVALSTITEIPDRRGEPDYLLTAEEAKLVCLLVDSYEGDHSSDAIELSYKLQGLWDRLAFPKIFATIEEARAHARGQR